MNIHKDADETADIYNEFGKIYHQSRIEGGRFFNEFLEMPATLSLIPQNLINNFVLDAGCGSGIYARELARRGARVIGIDISETMLAIANEEKQPEDNISYHLGDLYQTDLPNDSVDLIVCNYVLESIKDIDRVFKEFYRVLKTEGTCIYSISHPLRALTIKEKINNREIWRLENYYDHGIRTSDFGQGMKIKKFKRTISEYIDSSTKAQFFIKKFYEPQPIPEGKKHDPEAYDIAMRLPQLLIIKIIKG